MLLRQFSTLLPVHGGCYTKEMKSNAEKEVYRVFGSVNCQTSINYKRWLLAAEGPKSFLQSHM